MSSRRKRGDGNDGEVREGGTRKGSADGAPQKPSRAARRPSLSEREAGARALAGEGEGKSAEREAGADPVKTDARGGGRRAAAPGGKAAGRAEASQGPAKPAGGRASVDRFEDDTAVLVTDAREEVRLPRSALPAGTREGDVVDLAAGAVDAEATERLRAEVREARAAAGAKAQGPGSFDL